MDNTKILISEIYLLTQNLNSEPFRIEGVLRRSYVLFKRMVGQQTVWIDKLNPTVGGLISNGDILSLSAKEIEGLQTNVPANKVHNATIQRLGNAISGYLQAYEKQRSAIESFNTDQIVNNIKAQIESEIERLDRMRWERRDAFNDLTIKKGGLEDELEIVDVYRLPLLKAIYDKLIQFANEFFPEITTTSTESQPEANKQQNLSELFENVSTYNSLMNLLVQKGYCEAGTYKWKDQGKGYKGLAAAIIKCLKPRGYFKPEITTLSNDSVVYLCKNSFQIDVGIDTVKRANSGKFEVSFIPPATALNTQNTPV